MSCPEPTDAARRIRTRCIHRPRIGRRSVNGGGATIAQYAEHSRLSRAPNHGGRDEMQGETSVRQSVSVGLGERALLAEAVEGAMAQTARVLGEFVDQRIRVASGRSDVAARLWTDLAAVVGGKLMRPRLAVAAYLGLRGGEPAAVAQVAAAVEVLHTAMLVHDDLLDHDEVRRGRPNVAGATRARLDGLGLGARAVEDQV